MLYSAISLPLHCWVRLGERIHATTVRIHIVDSTIRGYQEISSGLWIFRRWRVFSEESLLKTHASSMIIEGSSLKIRRGQWKLLIQKDLETGRFFCEEYLGFEMWYIVYPVEGSAQFASFQLSSSKTLKSRSKRFSVMKTLNPSIRFLKRFTRLDHSQSLRLRHTSDSTRPFSDLWFSTKLDDSAA